MSVPTPGYARAAFFLFASGVLHLVAPVFPGIRPETIAFVVIGAAYCALSRLLRQGRRGLAWLVYFVMLFGSIAALGSMGSSPFPNWLLGLILLADVATAVMLFGVLWKNPASLNSATS